MDTNTVILIYRDTEEAMRVFVFTGSSASADADTKAIELVSTDFPDYGVTDIDDIRTLEEEESIAIDFFGIEEEQAEAHSLDW